MDMKVSFSLSEIYQNSSLKIKSRNKIKSSKEKLIEIYQNLFWRIISL